MKKSTMIEPADATDIDALVNALLDDMGDAESDDDLQVALVAHAEKIRTISKACEDTGLFSKSVSQFEDFKAELESTTVPDKRLVKAWIWFLNRIVEAPTRLHMMGAVRLCVPLVACYLPSESA